VVWGKTEASVSGWARTLNSFQMNGIFVVNFLELDHYFQVIESKCVICEKSQKTSHIIVVCRILGIPVVEVESIDDLEHGNVYLHIDFNSNTISCYDNEVRFPEVSVSKIDGDSYPRMGHNLSIVNSPLLVKKIIKNCKGDVEQLFLRSEFLWLSLKNNPYVFLKEKGIDATVQAMYEELRVLYASMGGSYILHFRGLDLRSDQRIYNNTKEAEQNPHLGLHGIRQLLLNPLYLVAELKAMDKLLGEADMV
jgi:phosphoenolpyruvate-protein kinase (PTS system EI component)